MVSQAEVGVPTNLLDFLATVLYENRITIDDGQAELPPVTQTTGLAQGDDLYPLLFFNLKRLNESVEKMSGSHLLCKRLSYIRVEHVLSVASSSRAP